MKPKGIKETREQRNDPQSTLDVGWRVEQSFRRFFGEGWSAARRF